MICDLIHEWGREKTLSEVETTESEISSKKYLDFIYFYKDNGLIEINHTVKGKVAIKKYAEEIITKLIKLKKKLPVKVEWEGSHQKLTDQIMESLKEVRLIDENNRILKPLNKEDRFTIKVIHSINEDRYYRVKFKL